MNEIQTESVTSTNISMNEPAEPRSPMSRKQESEERKKKFFEELKAAHAQNEIEPSPVRNEENKLADLEPQESAPTQSQDNDEDDELANKLIPKKRFDKEIEKRKLLEAEVRQERDARIKYQTEMELYNKALDSMQESKRAHEPELNVVDEDAHRFYMNKIDALEKKINSQTNNFSDYEVKQNFTNTVNYQAAEIKRTHPDFDDAYSYLLNVEASKAKMLGYDEQSAQNFALEQLRPIAWKSFQNGQNVAEMAYNIAKSYGYKSNTAPKAKEADFDKVNRNMQRSHSVLDDMPAVATTPATESAQYTTFEGFNHRMKGKNGGRGVDREEFLKAVKKLQTGSQY